MTDEAQNQIVSKLHQILKPFLLRRLKLDGSDFPCSPESFPASDHALVEKDLPKKKEYLLLAPLTPQQLELYEATVNKDLRQALMVRNQPKSIASN